MALKYSKDFDQGFTSANAYVFISRVNSDKVYLRFDTETFYDQAARDAGNQSLAYGTYEIPMPTGTGNDLLTDLYNHLKTLPEFAGAVDV